MYNFNTKKNKPLSYNEVLLLKYYREADERGKRAILNGAQIVLEVQKECEEAEKKGAY